MKITVTLPHPRNAPNGRIPLTRQAAIRANYASMSAKKQERHDSYTVALHETRKVLDVARRHFLFVPKMYSIVWYYRGVRPDADNVVARCKHVLDGCAAAFGVNDRTWELGRVKRVHDLEKGGRVELIFTDDGEEANNDRA